MERLEQGRDVRIALFRAATQEIEHMVQACEIRRVYEFFVNTPIEGKVWDDLVELPAPEENYRMILQLIDATIDAFPHNVWPRCVRARALWATDSYAAAVEDLQKAIEIAPHDALPLALLGETYYLMERYELAVSTLHRAITENPLMPRSHYARALSYRGRASMTADRDQRRILYSLLLMDLEMAQSLGGARTPYLDHILHETHQAIAAL